MKGYLERGGLFLSDIILRDIRNTAFNPYGKYHLTLLEKVNEL